MCTGGYSLYLHVGDRAVDPVKKETPMSRYVDQRTYQTFEEFEREELRRDGYFESVEDMMDNMFAGELDFEGGGKRASSHDDDDE
jgi:hypothetical protein